MLSFLDIYKPTKNPFQTPSSVKEEPVVAKAEIKPQIELNSKTPNSEPKPKTNTERLNIKPEREPNQLDKIKNKIDELRKKLFNEKSSSPETPSNPDFADVPCLATSIEKPWDVAMGLVEVAEAKNCLEVWDEIKKDSVGKKGLEKAQKYLSDIDKLKKNSIELSSRGRSGGNSREFLGDPDTIYKTKGNHIIITDNEGRAILDISIERIKVFTDYYSINEKTIVRREVKLPDPINPKIEWIPDLELQEFLNNL